MTVCRYVYKAKLKFPLYSFPFPLFISFLVQETALPLRSVLLSIPSCQDTPDLSLPASRNWICWRLSMEHSCSPLFAWPIPTYISGLRLAFLDPLIALPSCTSRAKSLLTRHDNFVLRSICPPDCKQGLFFGALLAGSSWSPSSLTFLTYKRGQLCSLPHLPTRMLWGSYEAVLWRFSVQHKGLCKHW